MRIPYIKIKQIQFKIFNTSIFCMKFCHFGDNNPLKIFKGFFFLKIDFKFLHLLKIVEIFKQTPNQTKK